MGVPDLSWYASKKLEDLSTVLYISASEIEWVRI